MSKKLTKDQNYEERFRFMIESVGGWDKSASISGRSVAQLKRYAKGDDIPFSVLFSLAEAADLSIDWISDGFENPFKNDRTEHLISRIDKEIQGLGKKERALEGLINVPVINVTASAGGGALVIEEKSVGIAAFSEEYLRTNWHVNPKELFCMPVDGESMEPTIKSGEFMLVSHAERHKTPGDGIYIIRLDGSVLVKRIQLLPGAKIKIFSDNAAYEPFEISLSDGVDFTILGKVVLVHGLRRV